MGFPEWRERMDPDDGRRLARRRHGVDRAANRLAVWPPVELGAARDLGFVDAGVAGDQRPV